MVTPVLPFIAPNLIDRDKELAHITTALTADTPLLTIVGPGGAGKTHLSVRTAQRLQAQFERVVFVDLSVAKVDTVLPMVLQQLELPGSDNILGQLAYVFSQHKTLLILDNFETVLEAAPQINELLAQSPSLRILVTSRSRLGLRAESCLPLLPLVTDPKDAPAVDFFVKRVQTLQPHFSLEGQEADIYKLCQRLDGLPLALELAAACIPAMTPGALLEHLGSHTSLPEVTVRDLPLRQQNLYQLVVSSVSLLGVREQNFFCRLGVFVGSFSLEAASAVTDAEALGLDATATLIKLCEHSLVVAEPVSPPRYKLLETIRAVALEMLSDLDPFAEAEAETTLQQTQRRHLEYYLGFSREHASAEPQNKLTLFEREFPNSCLAIRWAATQNESLKELGLRLLVNTAWFWNVKGYIAEGLNYFNLYSVHRNYPAALLTKWFHGRAYFLVEAGHVSESLQFGHEALELAQSLENLTTCADISILLGYTYLKQCDFSKALEYYEKAAHLREQLGNSASLPILTNNRGSVYRQLGDTVRARSCFEEALKGARELGDVQAQAMYLGNVAITWMYEDKYYAIKLLEEALEFARQVDNQRETAMILQNLSELFYKTNQLDKAQALAQESLAIKKTLGDLYNIALILSNLGIYAQHVQDNDTALQYFRESQELFRKLGAPMREAGAKSLAARHWHDDPPKAFKVHSEAMQIILRDSLIDAEYMTVCLDALLDLEIKVGRLPEAAVLWGAIQKLAVYDREVMWSREGLGQLEQTLDKETFELAVERGKTINLNDLYQELRQRWTPANTSEQKISVQTQTHTDALSVRQLEVLKLVAQGYSSKKIAKTFGLSEPTVKYHLNSIYNKLGVNSRAEAVAQATQRHLL